MCCVALHVVAGAEAEHIHTARLALEDQLSQVPEREKTRAANGEAVFRGRPSMLVIDESGDFLEDRKWEPAPTAAPQAGRP